VNKISAIAMMCLSLPLSERALSSNNRFAQVHQQTWPHQAEFDQLSAAVPSLQGQLTAAHQQLGQEQQQSAYLNNIIQQRQASIDQQSNELARLYALVNAKNSEVEQRQASIDQQSNELARLYALVSAKNYEVEQGQVREIAQLEQLRLAQASLATLEGHLTQTQQQKTTAEAQVQSATQAHTEALALHEQQVVQRLNQAAQPYITQIDELKANLVQHETTILGLNTEITRLLALVETNRQLAEQAQSRVVEQVTQLDAARVSQLDLEARLREATEQLEVVKGQMIASALTHQQTLESQRQVMTDLERAVNDLATARADSSRATEQQRVLLQELETSKAELVELRAKLEHELVMQKDKFVAEILKMQEASELVRARQKQLEDEVSVSEEEVEELTAKISSVRALHEKEIAEVLLNAKEQQILLETQVEDLRTQNHKLKQNKKKLEEENQLLQTRPVPSSPLKKVNAAPEHKVGSKLPVSDKENLGSNNSTAKLMSILSQKHQPPAASVHLTDVTNRQTIQSDGQEINIPLDDLVGNPEYLSLDHDEDELSSSSHSESIGAKVQATISSSIAPSLAFSRPYHALVESGSRDEILEIYEPFEYKIEYKASESNSAENKSVEFKLYEFRPFNFRFAGYNALLRKPILQMKPTGTFLFQDQRPASPTYEWLVPLIVPALRMLKGL
jgi:hypothetical protein